jgi:Amt family ammonium transporter
MMVLVVVQFWIQAKSVLVTAVWSGVAAVVGLVIARVLCGGLRVDTETEHQGLDCKDHGEEAYGTEA